MFKRFKNTSQNSGELIVAIGTTKIKFSLAAGQVFSLDVDAETDIEFSSESVAKSLTIQALST